MSKSPKWYENPLLISLLSSRLGSALIGVLLSVLMGLVSLPLGVTEMALDAYWKAIGVGAPVQTEPSPAVEPSCPPCPEAPIEALPTP